MPKERAQGQSHKGGRRPMWTEQEARELLATWEKSGQSIYRFARERGVCPKRLYWWKKRLAPVQGQSDVLPAFLPVTVRSTDNECVFPRAPLRVTVGQDVSIDVHRLDAGSASWVAALVGQLGEVGS